MKLSDLHRLIPGSEMLGEDIELTDVACDSRKASAGSLFVALRGARSDGHDFISEALFQGASALCINADMTEWFGSQGVPALTVPDTRAVLPFIAAAVYEHPSRALDLIGVTGTNGKTTTVFMIESILSTWGEKTGLIGTVGAWINGKPLPLERTTPESADLQRLFALMRDQGVARVAMEVSSQGILAERTQACRFDTGVWTNLTQDHLDAHGSMEEYFQQKRRLFTEYPDAYPEKRFSAVINADDAWGVRIADEMESTGRQVLRYSLTNPQETLYGEIRELRPDGTELTIHYRPPAGSDAALPVSLRMGGRFNAANALAAAGSALLRRVPLSAIKNGLERLHGVPGRFELVDSGGRGIFVVVDYAHTPDGLENALRSARDLNPKRLLCVFGCGGDRDRAKRPLMGRLSAELADWTIVTSDNPRSEHPTAIIADVLRGIEGGAENPRVAVEPDRRAAIKAALCEIAAPGDLILIAGKGHESGQIFANHTTPFDDRAVAREVLAECA